MDTSLMASGLLIAHLASTDGDITVDQIRGIDPAAIQRYTEQCDMKCYACKLNAEISKTEPCRESGRPGVPISGRPVSASIAYVLHTSGTTGRPRMVQVPHCSIVPNIIDLRSRFRIEPDDVIFNAAPLTFDPCFVEVISSPLESTPTPQSYTGK